MTMAGFSPYLPLIVILICNICIQNAFIFILLLKFKYTSNSRRSYLLLKLIKIRQCSICICYLDVNWLILKIWKCRARIWSLLASERSGRVTNFIFCWAGWYFSVSITFTFRWHAYLTWLKNNKNRVATFIQAWYPQANEPPNYIHVPNHINKQVT
jgi:hypothetical protein